MGLFLLIWFGLGLVFAPLVYAMDFAFWQGAYPTLATKHYDSDKKHSIGVALLSVLSPFSVLQVWLLTGRAKHGLKWS